MRNNSICLLDSSNSGRCGERQERKEKKKKSWGDEAGAEVYNMNLVGEKEGRKWFGDSIWNDEMTLAE